MWDSRSGRLAPSLHTDLGGRWERGFAVEEVCHGICHRPNVPLPDSDERRSGSTMLGASPAELRLQANTRRGRVPYE